MIDCKNDCPGSALCSMADDSCPSVTEAGIARLAAERDQARRERDEALAEVESFSIILSSAAKAALRMAQIAPTMHDYWVSESHVRDYIADMICKRREAVEGCRLALAYLSDDAARDDMSDDGFARYDDIVDALREVVERDAEAGEDGAG